MRIYHSNHHHYLNTYSHKDALSPKMRHSIANNIPLLRQSQNHDMPFLAIFWKYGNINPLSITYPFRVLLRDRLTLGRLPLPRKPWVCGGRVFHSSYCYSCQHSHCLTLHQTLRFSFDALGTLFYQSTINRRFHIFGKYLSPVILSAQDHLTSELLRFL